MKRWLTISAVSVLCIGVVCAGVVWNGLIYENVGCDGSMPQDCLNGGGVVGSDGSIYFEGYMHWRATGPVESDTHDGSSDKPFTGSRIVVNEVVRQNVFQKALPAQQTKKEGGLGISAAKADLFYNLWEAGAVEGSTLGINSAATFGDKNEFTFTVPLYMLDPEGGDSRVGVGLDATWKRLIRENWIVGLHANWVGCFGDDDDSSSLAGGPFGSFVFRPARRWVVSLGALFEITQPDEGDAFMELAPAGNVGVNLTPNLALNAFGIYFRNLDTDVEDPDYVDVGADVMYSLGTWNFSAGLKTALGLDDVSSIEAFLGSERTF